MIPFWKKTGKHSKPQSTQKRRQKAKPAVPRTAQQSIPMQRMFEDGTCRVKPNYYTRTIQYQDINYQLAQQEDKTAIFEEWCSFLNFFDSSIKFELSFVNMATDSTEFEKSIRIPFQKDGFDDVRAEYSQMLRQQLAKGNNGLTKTKFITFGVEGESMAQVKPRLDHIQNDLLNNFHRLGVQAKPLNGAQRLKLMHDMFNMDGASKFHFDWKDLVKSGLSVKDAIAPTAFAFKNSRTFQMGGIFCAASFLSITASDISDQLLKDFLDMDAKLLILDPLSSYIGENCSMNNANETRAEFNHLIAVAKDTGCAIVIIAHMNKMKDNNPLYRTNGSIDIAGAVRSILAITRTPNKEAPAERYLVQVKSNLAPTGSAILFEVAEKGVDFISEMEMTAEEAFLSLAPQMGRPNEKEMKAKSFLIEMLQDGEMLSSDCEEKLEAAGFKKSTIKKAKKNAGVISKKKGFLWYWSLPMGDIPRE